MAIPLIVAGVAGVASWFLSGCGGEEGADEHEANSVDVDELADADVVDEKNHCSVGLQPRCVVTDEFDFQEQQNHGYEGNATGIEGTKDFSCGEDGVMMVEPQGGWIAYTMVVDPSADYYLMDFKIHLSGVTYETGERVYVD